MRTPRFLTISILALAVLAGCGTKTPLTLPPQAQTPPAADNSKAPGPGR